MPKKKTRKSKAEKKDSPWTKIGISMRSDAHLAAERWKKELASSVSKAVGRVSMGMVIEALVRRAMEQERRGKFKSVDLLLMTMTNDESGRS